jgi:hypothetical protein
MENLSETKIELAMKEYTLLRQEIWLHIGFFKGHVTKFQLMGSAILAVGAYVLSNATLFPNHDNWWAWWVGATIVPILCHYLIFDVIGTQYAIILLGERVATLEEELNAYMERRLFIWETLVTPLFWRRFRPMQGVINPDWFLGFFGGVIAVFNSLLVPIFLYAVLWKIQPESLAMKSAIWGGLGAAITFTCITLYAYWRVQLKMRGKPRLLFRRMALRDAEATARDDAPG